MVFVERLVFVHSVHDRPSLYCCLVLTMETRIPVSLCVCFFDLVVFQCGGSDKEVTSLVSAVGNTVDGVRVGGTIFPCFRRITLGIGIPAPLVISLHVTFVDVYHSCA